MQSCSLLRERFPRQRRKSPNFSLKTVFLRNFPSHPLKLCVLYSDRGPAIVSDEIMETARCGCRKNIKVARSDCK